MGTEGRKVLDAMSGGPELDHDKVICFITDRNTEDRARAESAGESRQKIGQFLEDHAMNGKALSWLRQIVKVNDKSDSGQAKAMDIILSLKAGLAIVEDHVRGQQSAMDFDPADADDTGPVDFDDAPPPAAEFADDPEFEALLAASTLSDDAA
jgi:hypothetical protein